MVVGGNPIELNNPTSIYYYFVPYQGGCSNETVIHISGSRGYRAALCQGAVSYQGYEPSADGKQVLRIRNHAEGIFEPNHTRADQGGKLK